MSESSNEIPPGKPEPSCECYKKLHLFGVPLYISEENEEYSERQDITYENAFQLPGPLNLEETVTEYPVVEEAELSSVFRFMSRLLPNLADFEVNVLSFWILDVFIEGLWTAQSALMPHDHQKIALQWIAYFFNYIQQNNPTRRELFNYLKTLLFLPEKSEKESRSSEEGELEELSEGSAKTVEGSEESDAKDNPVWELPLPPGIKRQRKDDEEEIKGSAETSNGDSSGTSEASGTPRSSSSSGFSRPETPSERNVRHMKVILGILYRIFARLWVFMEIQTAFHGMPPVEQVNLPFTLNLPKPRFIPEPPPKGEKGGKKPQVFEKTEEEIQAERELRKNDYILPLQESDEAKLYMKQLLGWMSDRSGPPKEKGGKK